MLFFYRKQRLNRSDMMHLTRPYCNYNIDLVTFVRFDRIFYFPVYRGRTILSIPSHVTYPGVIYPYARFPLPNVIYCSRGKLPYRRL